MYRFGSRRRQCSQCKRTWRIRRKRRGRRHRRIAAPLLDHVLLGHLTLRGLAGRARVTPQGLSYRFHRALSRFVAQPRLVPSLTGNLVLLADGLWFRFQQKPWVLYLTALKPCQHNYALFLDPVLLPGRETVQIWRKIVHALPAEVKARVRALVSDDLRGMKSLAMENGWVFQLCQFHLISQLQGRRGRIKQTVPGRNLREALYQLTRQALELPDGPALRTVLRRLHWTVGQPGPSARMRMAVRQFLREMEHYRAYRFHPELGLPATTNAVETMGRILRDLMRRTRSLSSPEALHLWVTALIRKRPQVICNGKQFQPN